MGGGSNDLLIGGSGNDTLDGGSSADTILGGPGDDTLYGGSAGDVLIGGGGSDVLYGDNNNDTFLFSGAQDGDVYTVERIEPLLKKAKLLHYRLKMRKVLTSTGPYAWVRNPIYIANTSMLVGLTCTSEHFWFVPIMLLWCAVVYHYVVRREESHLRDKYGAHMAREVQSNSPRMELVRRVEPGRFFAWIHAPDQQCSSEYAIEARVDPD